MTTINLNVEGITCGGCEKAFATPYWNAMA